MAQTLASDGVTKQSGVVPWPTLRQTEKAAIVAALGATGHNCWKASKRLGISRTVLYRKLKKHGLKRRDGKWQESQ
jgi:transcriptional regulator of acetoin/glycerol metabolism